MKKFFISLALILIFLLSKSVLADTVTQFIFTTEPQSIPISELSNKIIIHSETPVAETTYITLNSTSNTGQFFSNTTSAEPITSGSYVYISINNSNRTVYYKDITAGNFVLTANIFNKDKTQQLAIINQNINVGQISSDNNSNATTTETTTLSSTSDESSSTQGVIFSAHSSPAPLSNTENKIEFEISAGRNRLTSVGNLLSFQAIPTKLQNILEQTITYEWSFGDGTTGRGSIVNHTYRFPGEYAVVVNASSMDKQAVSRLSVVVISPSLFLARVSGGLEISNKSKAEINLEGWSLVSNNKNFIFPKDTLISAGKKVTFADEITGMSADSIELINPMKKSFATLGALISPELGLSEMSNLDNIQAKINEVKTTLAKISITPQNNIQIPIPESELVSISVSETDVSTTTNTATVFEASKQIGLISSIFSWPIKSFNFVKHLFIED